MATGPTARDAPPAHNARAHRAPDQPACSGGLVPERGRRNAPPDGRISGALRRPSDTLAGNRAQRFTGVGTLPLTRAASGGRARAGRGDRAAGPGRTETAFFPLSQEIDCPELLSPDELL